MIWDTQKRRPTTSSSCCCNHFSRRYAFPFIPWKDVARINKDRRGQQKVGRVPHIGGITYASGLPVFFLRLFVFFHIYSWGNNNNNSLPILLSTGKRLKHTSDPLPAGIFKCITGWSQQRYRRYCLLADSTTVPKCVIYIRPQPNNNKTCEYLYDQ